MRIFSLLILILVLAADVYYLSHEKKAQSISKEQVTYPTLIDTVHLQNLLEGYSDSTLQTMLNAGEEILEWNRLLEKTDSTVVSEIMNHTSEYLERWHYPKGDVVDRDTGSQYYYHIHSPHIHGHFHLFSRPSDPSVHPIRRSSEKNLYAHLVGISIDETGQPVGLFTTNQWVTNESWFAVADLEKMLDQFQIDHTYPSWATNQWLRAMVQLFRPQIIQLLMEKEQILQKHQVENPSIDAFEDRSIEVISKLPISVELQITIIQDILQSRQLSELNRSLAHSSLLDALFLGYTHHISDL